MDASQVSYDVLAHFDRPAVRDTTGRSATRGVGWVLHWFAALVTLFVAMTVLARFGYCLAAELALVRAARAGVLEATLPRATYQSVVQSVERRLAGYPPRAADRLRFSLLQNGAPVRGIFQLREGDRLCVALALPTDEVLPAWLRAACFWLADSQLNVRAERQIPERRLPAAG
ncbi:MAG: hypothetical protein WD738_08660 [Pirellulales bacterium]